MTALRVESTHWRPLALLICLLAVAYPLLAAAIEGLSPSPRSSTGGLPLPRPGLSAPLDLPSPEPLVFEPVGPDRARMLNAKIPMAATPGTAARPFLLLGDLASRERAIDCLASSMWYEAGDDARGQRAVGQVVLNRVRHPSFPASVCGVVFQGSDRQTGCQFTFTCDGALARKPNVRQLAAARVEARALLDGVVDRDVGLATHYHTDWVHPVWSARMSKIARVDTHLFFRWAGRWGDRSTMARAYTGAEPVIAALAGISTAHQPAEAQPSDAIAQSPPALMLPLGQDAPQAQTAAAVPDVFELPVQAGGNGGAPARAALDLCGDRQFCKVLGRTTDGAQGGSVAFLFIRDRRTGVERVFWDCTVFRRANAAQCLSDANRSWIGFTGNLQSERAGAAARLAR